MTLVVYGVSHSIIRNPNADKNTTQYSKVNIPKPLKIITDCITNNKNIVINNRI